MSPNLSESIDRAAAELRRTHGKIAGVALEGDGCAFFRRPTAEEWDELQAQHDMGGDEKRKGNRAIVRRCFVGAVLADASVVGPEAFSDVCAAEGPAWVFGPAGAVITRLAGAKERAPARFF